MRDVAVIGIGMTRFGKLPDRSIKDLVREAVLGAMQDSGIRKKDIGAADDRSGDDPRPGDA